jgi:hypothetical protein
VDVKNHFQRNLAMRSVCALVASALSAMLAACAGSAPDNRVADPPGAEAAARVDNTAAPAASATAPRTYRPGVGVVESASVVSLSSSPSAAAGGTAGATTSPTMAYRLKMADGSVQHVVQAGKRFQVGERVEIASDGRLMRP